MEGGAGGKPYGVKLFDLVSCETEDWGSLDEALLWMDRQMDRRSHPHAGTECRSFDPEDTDRRRAEGEVRHQAWLEGRPDPYLPKRPEPADIPKFPKGCAVSAPLRPPGRGSLPGAENRAGA